MLSFKNDFFHLDFKIQLCCSIYQYFIFVASNIPMYKYICSILCVSINMWMFIKSNEHLRFQFPFSVIKMNAAMKIQKGF